ncbi:MAG: single-stranded-DNA-specific exonuclease RecJ [Anaerolineales bacterium]
MTKWISPAPVDIPAPFGTLNLPPLIAQTLIRRGISDPAAAKAFLDPEARSSVPPYDLPGMEKAVERITLAIRNKELVCVWGDFDVDGQTSTALLVQTLASLGADVRYHIPIRAVSSHGVHISELSEIIDNGSRLIVTCDTGIGAHEAVAYAKSRGVDFVITDHHDPIIIERRASGSEVRSRDAYDLPDAVAVVNPKFLPEEHPLATMAGVGVAYKLAEALLDNRLQTADNSSSVVHRLSSDELLDLVALGLIADVATLKGETRALAQKGIDALRTTQRLGLQTIMALASVQPETINEETIGFTFAPRLNAIGRLGDANPVVELLTTTDPVRAQVIATQLEGLNSQRRLLTSQVYRAAEAQLRADPSLLKEAAIVLGHPSWPGGVVGIVASRLKDKYNKPVILLNTAEGEPARGSARSIEGLHITEAIAAQKDLLLGFGGHPMAAGLAIEQENLPAFRKRLNKTIENMLGEVVFDEPSLHIDAWLGLGELSLELADTIEQLAPFGAGNPPLTFASRNVTLKAVRAIGKTKEHLRLNLEDDSGNLTSVLWWNGLEDELPETGSKIDIAYSLRASTFRGERQLQLQYVDFRMVEEKPVEIRRKTIEVVDLRGKAEGLKVEGLQVFVEAEDRKKIVGKNRYELVPSDELAIYTSPPGATELREILERVRPQKVYLVAKKPPAEKPDEFLTRLAGMAKFVIAKRGGETSISEIASATGQRESTVRLGLEWLAAGGHVTVVGEGDAMTLSAGDGEGNPYVQQELYVAVKGLLEETAAYRNYVVTVKDPMSLLNS